MAKIIRSNPPQKKQLPLSEIDTVTLIQALLERKDPSWTQLNRIIRRKEVEQADFPLQESHLSEFRGHGKGTGLFSEDEKTLLQQEAKIRSDITEIATLKKKLVEVEKASYQKGMAEGLTKGKVQGHEQAKQEMDAQVSQLQSQVSKVLKAVQDKQAAIFKEAELVITNLVMAIVRKLIQVESATNPQVIKGVTQKALQLLGEGQHITIRVHPEDAPNVRGEYPFWLPVNKASAKITIEEDARIERGGCIVDTGAGQVDARLDTQAKKMEDIIHRVWEEEAGQE